MIDQMLLKASLLQKPKGITKYEKAQNLVRQVVNSFESLDILIR